MLAFAAVSRELVRDALLYLVVALVLGTAANLVSGRSLAWWGQGKQPPQTGVDFVWIDAESANALLTSLPNVVIVDTRAPADFAASHVAGAISLPYTDALDELTPTLLATLKGANAVILYGSSPEADTEQLLAQELRLRGVAPPQILVGAFEGWVINGLPVAQGSAL
jgi:rhodanese-related sulfurtransferase